MIKKTKNMTRIRNLIVAGIICCASLGRAQDNSAATDADRFRRLEEAVKQLQQENRELRQQVQELKPALANTVPGTNATYKAAFATSAAELAASSKSPFVLP